MSGLFISQFSYCPLSWMFHSHKLNKIKMLHERCLCIIYSNNIYSFKELFKIGNSVLVDFKTTKLYEAVNGLSLKLVKDCFKLSKTTVYNTRNRYHSIKVKIPILLIETKNLGNCAKWYEKPFITCSLQNCH